MHDGVAAMVEARPNGEATNAADASYAKQFEGSVAHISTQILHGQFFATNGARIDPFLHKNLRTWYLLRP